MEAINADYNERMRGLRFAAVLGLVFWTGGLAALGAIGAPAIFDAMGPAGRSTAGTVFGEVLSRFHAAAYVGSISTAFFQRYSASFQRPFWATLMPNSTCFFASERSLARAAGATKKRARAQERIARRIMDRAHYTSNARTVGDLENADGKLRNPAGFRKVPPHHVSATVCRRTIRRL